MDHVKTLDRPEACYRGLRMDADAFLALPEDAHYRYELTDGVVCMSPSPSFRHQAVIIEIASQVHAYLKRCPVGQVVAEVNVKLADDRVYRPDVVFVRSEKAARCTQAVTEIPDLVVEVISPDSRVYDTRTKRGDYESAGVGEYWLIDPERKTFQFLVLRDGRYEESRATPDRYATQVLPGFELDLDAVRRLF